MKFLKELYKKYYCISPLDLANIAETNRLASSFWSLNCLLIIFVHSTYLLIVNRNNLKEIIPFISIISVGAIVCLISFIIAKIVKNVPREKAYILKNIPVYMVYLLGGFGSALFFYFNSFSVFEALIVLMLSATIAICVFSVALPFFIIFTAGACVVGCQIIQNYSFSGLVNLFVVVSLLWAVAIYKRYQEKQHLELLRTQKKNLEVKTFGNFTPLYDKNVIKFSRSKSPELLAYLIYKNGSSVNTKELLSVLYGDYADSARYGASLRLLISDIKHSLSELDIQNFFIAEYNNFRINPEVVQCDYYDLLAGDPKAVKSFTGEFMSQYSWAEDALDFLEKKVVGQN